MFHFGLSRMDEDAKHSSCQDLASPDFPNRSRLVRVRTSPLDICLVAKLERQLCRVWRLGSLSRGLGVRVHDHPLRTLREQSQNVLATRGVGSALLFRR